MRIQVFTRHETHNHPIQKKKKKKPKKITCKHNPPIQLWVGLGWFLCMWWVGFGWRILPTWPLHTPNCNKVACPHFCLPYKKPLSFLIGGLVLELQNAYCLSSFCFSCGSYAFIYFLFVAIFIWFSLYSVTCNDRGTHKKFPRLFFINYVKDQGGKLQNSIKYIAKEIVSLMLSVFCVQLAGGVRAEKLGDWLPFSFQIRMKLLNLLRYPHYSLCCSC